MFGCLKLVIIFTLIWPSSHLWAASPPNEDCAKALSSDASTSDVSTDDSVISNLADLRDAVQNPAQSIEVPSLRKFSAIELESLKAGQFERSRTLDDLTEEERIFEIATDKQGMIAESGKYKIRKVGTTRWNPIPFKTSENPAAKAHETKLTEKLKGSKIRLGEHLTPAQQKWVTYFMARPSRTNYTFSEPFDISRAADAIAVVRALSLGEATLLHGKTPVQWEAKIAKHNLIKKKQDLGLADLLKAIDEHQASLFESIEKKAELNWEASPERDYPEVLTEALSAALPAFALELGATLNKTFPKLSKEIKVICLELQRPEVYQKILSERARKALKHKYATATEVRQAASSHSQLLGLVRHVDSEKEKILAHAHAQAQKIWEANTKRPYAEVLKEVLATALPGFHANLQKSLPVSFPGLGNASKLLRDEVTSIASYEEWIGSQKPNLSFGEQMIEPSPQLVVAIPKDKMPLVKKLAHLGEIGSEADELLLEQMLGTVDTKLLENLVGAGYTIIIARNNVTHGAKDLRARSSAAGIAVDHSEGVHSTEPEKGRRIIVRSRMQDGKLTFNIGVLMHEIGHAVDLVLQVKGNDPLHVQKEFADAFIAEHKKLPPYFHDQAEFVAEVFSRYSLDRERAAREFPLSSKAFDKLGLAKELVDGKSLVELHKSMLTEAPVTARPEPLEVLRKFESLNRVRAQRGKSREPLILEMDGEAAATQALAKQLGAYLVTMRAPTISPFGVFDGFIHIDASIFNDPTALRKVLDEIAGGQGALLYVDDLKNITPYSAGFHVIKDFFHTMGDLAHLVLAGSKEARKPFVRLLHNVVRETIVIDPLTTHQVAELVQREVSNDGYELSHQAQSTLAERCSAGGYEAAMKLWRDIKQAQVARTTAIEAEVAKQPAAVSYVLARDVMSAKVDIKKNPLDDIWRMVGLTQVKEKIKSIVSAIALAKQAEALGIVVSEPPRLNLLFAGNPGTGKTTVAIKLAESLFDQGYVRSSSVATVKIQDIVNNPEESVRKLFEKNKGGVIFIDEFHQLKDTNEGKRAFRAMIPYLADPEYQDTVFIGAGYADELRELVRETDPGAERRFVIVHFADYSQDEIAVIADLILAKHKINVTDEVRAALIERVMRKQRAMKHPGNAGDMEVIVGLAREKQRARLAALAQQRKLTTEDFSTLTLEDVVVENPLTVEAVWKEIDALKGLDAVKAQLRVMQSLMDYNKSTGVDVLTGVEPYIIIEGPAGSGKSTLPALIGKLFAANDVIPNATVVSAVGGDLLGGFVGNSTTLAVRKLFEQAWGGTLFIDEIGALAKAVGGYEEQAAKEMLTQMENHRGKFVFVIADYPENIDAFLRLDAGLARRFGTRLTLTTMSARAATDLLHDLLKGFTLDAHELDALIVERLSLIAALPGWASGGDVRTLANRLRAHQARCFMAHTKEGRMLDPHKVHPDAMESALRELQDEIEKRPNQSAKKVAGNFAREARRQAETTAKAETKEALTTEDKHQLDMIAEVDKQFGDLFNTNPAELARQEEDANSSYNVALANKLGVSPESAKAIRVRVKVKVKKLVTVLEEKEVQHFKYHCPFCGGIESPTCAYINYPLEWKIEHSTRKPWTEKVKSVRQEEIEEDEIQERSAP